ncbi:outer membrane lipoprotein-sorting protein [Rheinheimera baltica]|uniref:Outer membrane lipoprotein-sorting protein n=1 Tax=Rheinheimera baltica TaxID=67576 RepID=A0ABT9I141_9GAMM|nr:outer membrane lipoprotein-sorting protein [Rheinheimera baltica]MDP5137107.1 outer membrane lipoprotein-sorting protein [Rheinheimera baltica]MDP5142416.1 outer membrane lipoprotein-sorting protein [Rheinheimera baltica]MDP5150681.1 outer membrane lipoprotein-sorting protein [Rheinheimera baltica]
MRNYLSTSLLLLSLVSAVNCATLLADEAKGLAIAQERKNRDAGWGDSESLTSMILRSAGGDESRREMRTAALEVQGDGDKGLTLFDEPRDVRGTAFLNHAHPTAEDDQWLYLPALKRVKRIASRNKSGPFMGSEFAYEDLSSFELAKYRFNYLRDEPCGDGQCFVIEQTPADEYSGYSKTVAWLDKTHYQPIKVTYYDRKNSLLKTLSLEDYKLYLEKYWRPHKLTMENHQTGKSTDLLIHNIRFNTGRTAADFDTNALQRAR